MGHSGPMYFVGLDLAWGERNQTGVAAVDVDGRLLHIGAARDDASILAAIAPFTSDKPELKKPRAARLASALDLDMDPASRADRRAIEVYPHPATVVLFDLAKTIKYKRGTFQDRQRGLLTLMTLIEGLDSATPRLRAHHNAAWIEARRRIEAADRPSQLDREEDAIDAVVCAYVGLYRHHRPSDVTVYGDYASGYIVTPTLPPHRATTPKRRTAGQSGV